MSEERPIEKQLRDAAENRRQAAGGKFALHPATRRLLQGEVARTRGATTGAARRKSFFGLTWFRFASGVCTVGVLCFGTWVVIRTPPPPPNEELRPRPTLATDAIKKTATAGYVQNADSPLRDLRRGKEGFLRATPPAEPVVAAAPPAPSTPAPAAKPARRAEDEFYRKSRVEDKREVARWDSSKVIGDVAAETAPAKMAEVDGDRLRSRDQSVAGEKSLLSSQFHNRAAAEVTRLKASGNQSLPTSAGTVLQEPLASSVSLAKNSPAAPSGEAGASWKLNQSAAQNFAYRNEPLSGKDKKASGGRLAISAAQPRFTESERRAALGADAAPNAMFANFNISQTGDRIRIEDSDGSVYDGVLLAEAEAKQDRAPAAKLPANGTGLNADSLTLSGVVSTVSPVAVQNFQNNVRFNAAGTNLGLRQNVIITGAFVNEAVPAAAQNLSNGLTRQAQMMNGGTLISNGRIVGKAVTADGREFQLNAAPVLP